MRLTALLFARRREIERLFAITARAFGCASPPAGSRRLGARLAEYARFTCERAEEALQNPDLLPDIGRRLFRGAFLLGADLRLRLRVRSRREAMRAARLVYRGLGIDFRSAAGDAVVIKHCSFAAIYSGDVCRLISALDRGLLAGLAYYGELQFTQRITEGASECRACLMRRAG